MTIHKSLKVRATLARARNVWKRVERVIKLEEDGRAVRNEGWALK